MCIIKFAIMFYWQRGASAENFYQYMVEKVLPVIDEFSNDVENSELKLDVYKTLAEICTQKISDDVLYSSLEPIFTKLLVRTCIAFY